MTGVSPNAIKLSIESLFSCSPEWGLSEPRPNLPSRFQLNVQKIRTANPLALLNLIALVSPSNTMSARPQQNESCSDHRFKIAIAPTPLQSSYQYIMGTKSIIAHQILFLPFSLRPFLIIDKPTPQNTRHEHTNRKYNPEWAIFFQKLQLVFRNFLSPLLLDIQHVGSTSVEGLSAKPIIDIDLVIKSKEHLPPLIHKLNEMGYDYLGDMGITDRAAFKRRSAQSPQDGSGRFWPSHNLYICPEDSISLRNHLVFRDYLRQHPDLAKTYGSLKEQLALENPENIDHYVAGKTSFITRILKRAGFNETDIKGIKEQNKAS